MKHNLKIGVLVILFCLTFSGLMSACSSTDKNTPISANENPAPTHTPTSKIEGLWIYTDDPTLVAMTFEFRSDGSLYAPYFFGDSTKRYKLVNDTNIVITDQDGSSDAAQILEITNFSNGKMTIGGGAPGQGSLKGTFEHVPEINNLEQKIIGTYLFEAISSGGSSGKYIMSFNNNGKAVLGNYGTNDEVSPIFYNYEIASNNTIKFLRADSQSQDLKLVLIKNLTNKNITFELLGEDGLPPSSIDGEKLPEIKDIDKEIIGTWSIDNNQTNQSNAGLLRYHSLVFGNSGDLISPDQNLAGTYSIVSKNTIVTSFSDENLSYWFLVKEIKQNSITVSRIGFPEEKIVFVKK